MERKAIFRIGPWGTNERSCSMLTADADQAASVASVNRRKSLLLLLYLVFRPFPTFLLLCRCCTTLALHC